MAEQGTVCELKELEKQLLSLISRYSHDQLQADSKYFCSNFCKLVEHYASRWKVPLPQLRILERALCCFTQASTSFTVGSDPVLRTLSSLALSIFELLLFFDQKDFTQDPLRKITVTFQGCCTSLARFQNVHLVQVERLLRAGGPWVSQTLLAILSESTLPQNEVEGCISSEPPVFFELRVRYLLSSQRLPEAQALAKCCAQHPSVGQHLFFFQVYLTGLYKTAQIQRLLEEVADFSGKDAVNFICSLESEENDHLLLGFSRVFLSQQLGRGDMHFLCDLVSLWGRLHSRLKTSKEDLLKECEKLILSATNINAIFPFIRAIIQEMSEDGVPFCMELCANALCSCPPCDVITKSLIYKTMASLVPHDLEICRACALLVFFLERSVEAYKMVYILYMYPDQEYYVDSCPIGNRVRFETLQTLKKDLYFDPEFWNLIALRTNCLKLINENVLSAALEEIMEEKWVPIYCLKETKASSSRWKNGLSKEKTLKIDQQDNKGSAVKPPARKVGRPRLNKNLPLNKSKQGSKQWKNVSSEPTRRSTFWQTDRLHCNRALDSHENRRTTRLSERIPAKRMIRAPKWLLEDSGTLERNAAAVSKRQYPSFPYLPLRRRRVVGKSNPKDEVKSDQTLIENNLNDMKRDKEVLRDSQAASTAPQIILELSLPDNELLGSFTDESCNRHWGLPQRVFYKPMLKVPSVPEPEKATFQKEVILRAQDTTSFILMLHCYNKKPKCKNLDTDSQGSSSTVACFSDQAHASNEKQPDDKSAGEMEVPISSQTQLVTDKILSSSEKLNEEGCTEVGAGVGDTVNEPEVKQPASIATELEESAFKMEVKVAPQEIKHSPDLEKYQGTEHISSIDSKEASTERDDDEVKPPIFLNMESKPQDDAVTNAEDLVNGTPRQEDDIVSTDNIPAPFNEPVVDDSTEEAQTPTDNINNLPSPKTDAESLSKKPQSVDEQKATAPVERDPIVSRIEITSSNTTLEDDGFDPLEPQPECEESNLEFCCFFCHKDVKGCHLVAHAKFHYRKDECMFCGVPFRNNIKAMMHLSNHLEKLKKLQNPTASISPKKSRAKAQQRTTVKVKTLQNKKETDGEKTALATVRKLRSGCKLGDGAEQEEGSANDMRGKDRVHKVNGHIVKRKTSTNIDRSENLITTTRLRHRSIENLKNEEDEPIKIEKEVPFFMSSEEKVASKTKKTDNSKKVGSLEKLSCPVDGCAFFTVKRHAFLYHALENHHLDSKPLELAFHMANNSCSICKRVLYSFEHFQHHVGRHKTEPRHPCPHLGCTARFKTTIEMRRHARKHNPLQAVCCLPGCPKLFICQWALILHEKDHFSKRAKGKPLVTVKQELQENAIKKCAKSKEKVATTSAGKSPKDINQTQNSALPKKDRNAQSAATKLLQRLRKRQITKNNQSQQLTHKRGAPVGKRKHRLRHMQSRGSKAKPSLESKVLPPREAKSSQNSSCPKITALQKESNLTKTEVPKNPKADTKDMDVSQARSTGKAITLRITKDSATRKMDSNVSSSSKDQAKMRNNERTIRLEKKLKRTTAMGHCSVEEKMRKTVKSDAADTVRGKNEYLTETEDMQTNHCAEEVACQNEIFNPTAENSKCVAGDIQGVTEQNEQKADGDTTVDTPVCSRTNSIGETNMPAAVTEADPTSVMKTVAEEKPEMGKDNIISKAEECANSEKTGQENSNMESLENAPADLLTFTNTDVSNQVTPEKNAEQPESNKWPSLDSPFAPGFTSTKPNVALTHYTERGIVTVENVEDKADNTHSIETADGSTPLSNINNCAGQVTTDGRLAEDGVSILEDLESTELTAIKIPSHLGQYELKESEDVMTEGDMDNLVKNNSPNGKTSDGVSEPAEAQKLFRSKLCNKNDILSALKTLVKSKNEHVKPKNEVKSTASKRVNELGITSISKRFKSDMEDAEALGDACSASEKNESTDSIASLAADSYAAVPVLSNANVTSKQRKIRKKCNATKEKDLKKRRAGQSKIKRKPGQASKKFIHKKTLKTKKETSDAKSAKSNSKDSKVKVKAFRPDKPHPEASIVTVNEVTSQLNQAESIDLLSEKDQNREDGDIDRNIEEDYIETKPEMPRETSVQNLEESPQDTCSRVRDVYNLTAEEEDSPLATFEKALHEYKKRPYMRLPATAYLEEKFTVMPKRRKDMSMFFGPSQKIQSTPQQRQRCANCFNTFSSVEELQWHLQQKCSSLFGFDSEDEGAC